MRYVRLAETSTEQNLQLELENGRIFYRTTRDIAAHEELHVSYHSVYSARFLLPELLYVKNVQPVTELDSQCSRLRRRKPRKVTIKQADKRAVNKRLRNAKRQLKKLAQKQLKKEKTRSESKIRKELLVRLKKTHYKCNLCPKRFFTLQSLELHKKKHAADPERPFICQICQQQCITATALAAHVKVHLDSNFICIYCQEKYRYVRDFKKHVVTHQQLDGLFPCTHCQKLYNAYHLVRKHVRLFHNAERIFTCSDCAKNFRSSSELQRHRRTHVNEKPHNCNQCKRAFLRRDQLLAHQRRVHGAQIRRKKPRTTQASTLEAADKPGNAASVAVPVEEVVQTNSLISSHVPPAILSASSSNRRKQTPTKLKALEHTPETLNYGPLSELLTPYLISEQELHEEFEKAEVEALKVSTDADKPHEQHSIEETAQTIARTVSGIADTQTTDSIYKCHICLNVNFKRRGILVNHFSKVHPTLNLDSIAALNTPILKQQLIYLCCYCKNEYRSAAKRKQHILKHHPGCELPDSKQKHVQALGSQPAEVHKCQLCKRQYAARSRLVAHYRIKHAEADLPAKPRPTLPLSAFEEPLLEPEMNMMSAYPPASVSPENKLLKLSSAALELSRFDFLNERSTDEYNRFPSLFDETPLVGMDGLMDRFNHRAIEVQFFEKIGKL